MRALLLDEFGAVTNPETLDTTRDDAGMPVSEDAEASPGSAVRPVLRLAPLLAAGVLALGVVRMAQGPLEDPDVWWHVLSGQHLARTWVFTGPDPFSDFSTAPWTLNQWLPELGMGAVAARAGIAGVLAGFVVLHLLLLVLLFGLARKDTGPLPASIALVVGAVGSWGASGPRPQLAGMLLFALTTWGWLRTERDLKARWWLVGVGWLWACSHGTWPMGVALGIIVVAGLAADRRIQRRQAVTLAAVPVLAGLAALATPTGPALFASMRAVASISPYLTEWARTTISYPPASATLGACAVVLVVALRRGSRTPWTTILLVLFAVALTLTSLRTVALGAVVVTPLLSRALQRVLGRVPGPAHRVEWLGVTTALTVAGVAAVVGLQAPGRSVAPVSPSISTRLASAPAGAVVWDDIRLGGWLLWQHPRLRPTIDTRAEVFGPAALADYVSVMTTEPGWQSAFQRRSPDLVLVRRDSALAGALVTAGWPQLAGDNAYVLLGAPR